MRPPRPPGDPQIGRRSRATRSSRSSHTGESAVDDRLVAQERRRGARVAEQDTPGDPRSRRSGAAHRRGCWWGAAVDSCARASPPAARQSVAVGDLPRRRHGRDRCRVFTRLSGRVPPRVSVPASRARRRVRAENGEEELRMSGAAARRERVGRIVRRRGAPGARKAARTSSSTYPMDLERRQPPAASESLLPRARRMLMAPKLRRSGAGAAAAGTM